MSRLRAIRAGGLISVLAMCGAACTAVASTPEVLPQPVPFTGELDGASWSVSSPDGDLRIDLGLDDGAPVYRVMRDDTVVVGTSALGLETSRGTLGSGLSLADAGVDAPWTDSFRLPTGKQRAASVDGRARTVRFAAASADVDLEIDLLATDHGVAFRSRVIAPPGADTASEVRLDWERTSFAMPPEAVAWLQNHDRGSFARPAYEQRRNGVRPVSDPVGSVEGWTLPALFESEGHWTLVAEAGLDAGAAGSHLSPVTENGRFSLALPSAFDGNGRGAVEPQGELPLSTPWRVVITSTDVGDVVESNLVRHLSAPGPALDWVEPGIASWSWWSDQDSPRDLETLIDFVDLSAEFGWPYSLVDANWTELSDDEFTALVDHANRRDVGLLLWYNSGGPNNAVPEAPRGRMTDRSVRRAEMERIAALGVRGVKVDFFHSDKPAGVQQYLDILDDAADFELLVNFHGSTVPRGWSRTHPHLMTMEAVLGGEQYIFTPGFAAIAPTQNTVLAFTRNVVGSMDYTPLSLGNRYLRRTTNAHELALLVVFESGLQHLVDTPESYRSQPPVVRSVLADVPVAWDETRFLAGRPDEHVALARRQGDAWWIGAINGTGAAFELEVDVASLDLVGRPATVICDGADGRSYDIVDVVLAGSVELSMAPSGGCLVRVD